ncbi:MAG: divergent polysaccharide deacetylase family protein, partial [Thermoanaerobaculia bacterium]|nr:divergent polysaccharide deacetylase family protein [Thermoanaerobaculia bacterium]
MPRSRRRVPSPGSRLGLLGIVVVAFGLGFGLGRGSVGPAPAPAPLAEAAAARPVLPSGRPPEASGVAEAAATGAEPGPGVVAEPAPIPPPPASVPARLAIVIDDLGRSVETVRRLESLGVELSYAVLPFESHTADVERYLSSAGLETLVHVPMEAREGANPGPGALRTGMGPEQIRQATEEALAAVPAAVGVNNHMGSAFSESPSAMRPFLEVVASRGLYFLDSRTSAGTSGLEVARDLGLAAVERNVFLDGSREPESIRAQFRRALEIAAAGTPAV